MRAEKEIHHRSQEHLSKAENFHWHRNVEAAFLAHVLYVTIVGFTTVSRFDLVISSSFIIVNHYWRTIDFLTSSDLTKQIFCHRTKPLNLISQPRHVYKKSWKEIYKKIQDFINNCERLKKILRNIKYNHNKSNRKVNQFSNKKYKLSLVFWVLKLFYKYLRNFNYFQFLP